jgi:hypothetical protein
VVNGGTCADLSDFPVDIMFAVGANLKGIPLVCGGGGREDSDSWGPQNKCYKFVENRWQEFTAMKNYRASSSAIIYENKLHIFGGEGGRYLESTEIVSADGVSIDGPSIPIRLAGAAITTINTTVSIISGGIGGTNHSNNSLDKTWYFNHETQTFSPGPSLLEGRDYHASGTIIDRVTKDKTPIVAGGVGTRDSSRYFINSTELLINGEWQSGKIREKKLSVSFSGFLYS